MFCFSSFFFFKDTATTEIYTYGHTLSLHYARPIAELGRDRATILCEYPVAEAALARPAAHDPRVAERFELYACGVELANAFGELTDAGEQRRDRKSTRLNSSH